MAQAPATRTRKLNKDELVIAAVTLMEEAGDSGFSLRKLGERVGCDPMAVLYHFKSKEGLLRAMADFPVKRESSFLIGDKEADLEAARAAGVAGFLFSGGNLATFAEWTLAGFEDGHRG